MSEQWLVKPESAAPGSDGDWAGVFAARNQGLAPDASDRLALVLEHGGGPENPVVLSLDALLQDPAYRLWEGGALVATLHLDPSDSGRESSRWPASTGR